VYSHQTLGALLARHGWKVTDTCTYGVTTARERDGRRLSRRVLHAMLAGVLMAEPLVARWRPFLADGLIVVCEPAPD
jgi:hypothetical protein